MSASLAPTQPTETPGSAALQLFNEMDRNVEYLLSIIPDLPDDGMKRLKPPTNMRFSCYNGPQIKRAAGVLVTPTTALTKQSAKETVMAEDHPTKPSDFSKLRKDLTGKRFGNLLVRGPVRRQGRIDWECACDCGNTTVMRRGHLLHQRTVSCGCYRRGLIGVASLTHGEWRGRKATPEMTAYKHMLARCYNPKDQRYSTYGARGVKVCERWRNSYPAFLEDVGRRPSPAHSMDRINNDGDYEPSNVRWATDTQQARNRTSSKRVTWRGETRTLIEWTEITGIPYSTLWRRIKTGWDVEHAMTVAVDPHGSKRMYAKYRNAA